MSRLAFLGTGLLGSGMVECLLRRGNDVTVWNRTEAKARALEAFGATVARTPGGGRCGRGARAHGAVRRCRGRRHGRSNRSGRGGRDHRRPHDDVAGRHQGAAAACGRGGVKFVHAPVFMSPQMCRDATGLMLVSGPQAIVDTIRAGARADDRRGVVLRRARRSGRRLQDFRQLDDLHDHRRDCRRAGDGQERRRRAGRRGRAVRQVQDRRHHPDARRENGAG